MNIYLNESRYFCVRKLSLFLKYYVNLFWFFCFVFYYLFIFIRNRILCRGVWCIEPWFLSFIIISYHILINFLCFRCLMRLNIFRFVRIVQPQKTHKRLWHCWTLHLHYIIYITPLAQTTAQPWYIVHCFVFRVECYVGLNEWMNIFLAVSILFILD